MTSSDSAGTRTTIACKYTVVYAFRGFRAPIRNLDRAGRPVLNVVKAGRAILLTWRLTDAAGDPVTTLSTARISVVGISCDRYRKLRPVKGADARRVRLQHLGNGIYRLKWKPPTTFARSCKRLRLDLGEGNTAEPIYHTANLEFTPKRRSRPPKR